MICIASNQCKNIFIDFAMMRFMLVRKMPEWHTIPGTIKLQQAPRSTWTEREQRKVRNAGE